MAAGKAVHIVHQTVETSSIYVVGERLDLTRPLPDPVDGRRLRVRLTFRHRAEVLRERTYAVGGAIRLLLSFLAGPVGSFVIELPASMLGLVGNSADLVPGRVHQM
jgi:hypothetical protein